MPSVRIQGPSGTHDVALDATATMKDLKTRIETVLGIAPAAQQIKSGFPPALVSAGDEEQVSSILGAGSARILVSSSGAVAAAAAGTGRRKPQAVRRVAPGSTNPADAAAAASTSRASQPSASADAAGSGSGAASASAAPAAKRKRGGKGGAAPADEDEGDPLKRTLHAAKEEAAKAPGKVKGLRPRTVEQLVRGPTGGRRISIF